MSDHFENMFESHRGYLRRLLICLCQDIDQADDLLQETYLLAKAGFGGYRGGDMRAWLAAIARNAFYGYVRRRSRHAEQQIDDERPSGETAGPGSDPHISLLAIRGAIDGLTPQLRIALIMRHYAGYTYEQIAQEMQVPVGTVKWRVNYAIKAVRDAIGVQPVRTASSYCRRMPLLDYLYDLLPFDRRAAVAAHLRKCENCRNSLQGFRDTVSALDLIQGQQKLINVLELDCNGRPTLYVIFDIVSRTDDLCEQIHFSQRKGNRILHLLYKGDELSVSTEPTSRYRGCTDYTARLPHPVGPGQRMQFLCVIDCDPEYYQLEQLGGTERCFQWYQRPRCNTGYAFLQAVRLPAGAKLLTCEPEARSISTRETWTTVLFTKAICRGEQYRSAVRYAL